MLIFEQQLITDGTRKRRRNSRMTMSECMNLAIASNQQNNIYYNISHLLRTSVNFKNHYKWPT